jgi:hypothetical protein
MSTLTKEELLKAIEMCSENRLEVIHYPSYDENDDPLLKIEIKILLDDNLVDNSQD